MGGMEYRTIDDALHGFVVSCLGGSTMPAARRIVAVDAALRRYLDADGADALLPDERVLVDLERDLGTAEPLARLLPADRLLVQLPGFISATPSPTAVRRARLTQVWRLVQWLRSRGLVDVGEHAGEIARIREALASIRISRYP